MESANPGGFRHTPIIPREGSDFILCRLCRRPYKRITPTHLYWKHRINSEEYADRFPRAPLECAETRSAITRSIIVNWERQGRHWTKERVTRVILKLRAADNPLHARGVKERHPTLYGAGTRIFDSWNEALREAGIDPAEVRRRTPWDAKTITVALRKAKAAGLLRKGAHFRESNSGLVQATAKRWGSWTRGQIAAGLTPLRPPSVRWNRREVRRRIKERVSRGESLLATDVHTHAPALRNAAQELFGKPWSDVVRDLGYPYPGRERWTQEKVVRGIRRLMRLTTSLRLAAVRRSNLALAQAAVRHFGTWPDALRATGFDPAALKLRHWSRDELLQLFERLHRAGRMSRRHLRVVRKSGFYQPSSSALRYWKSLRAALQEFSKLS